MSRISTELILDHTHTIIRKQKVNRIEDKVHKELMFQCSIHTYYDLSSTVVALDGAETGCLERPFMKDTLPNSVNFDYVSFLCGRRNRNSS